MGRRRRGSRHPEPALGPLGVAQLEQSHGHAPGGKELGAPVALELRAAVGLLAARQRRVRDHLGPGPDVDAKQHLEVEAGPLALGDELRQPARDSPNLLEMARRGREVHDQPVLRVSHGDDRRHDASPVAEPLEDTEGTIEGLRRLDEEWADLRCKDHLLDLGARRDHGEELVRSPGPNLTGEPRAPLREVDRTDLP